jgi:hypothetical protein
VCACVCVCVCSERVPERDVKDGLDHRLRVFLHEILKDIAANTNVQQYAANGNIAHEHKLAHLSGFRGRIELLFLRRVIDCSAADNASAWCAAE